MGEPPLVVLGLDHHKSPVQVRERLAVAGDAVGDLLAALVEVPGVDEAVAVSTCNRVELYLAGAPERGAVIALLGERHGVPPDELAAHCYWRRGADCVRHLFRVVASLESLVIGESQIVHQVKSAYERALAAGRTGPVLNPFFQRALAVAKDVRNGTAIGRHRLSVASVAVDLARHIHGDLDRARLLLIGAGEIAELAVTHLLSAGVRDVGVVNRGQERAVALAAERDATVWQWSDLRRALAANDIVIASTSAPGTVVAADDVRAAMRGRRAPLMLIDLAVPRDVDDHVAKLEDVYLYNIDHLESVVAHNRSLRADEVDAAAALVESQARDYLAQGWQGRAALLTRMSTYFTDIVAAEEARLAGKLAVEDREQLRYGLERVGNKLQHQLLRWLRERPGDPEAERVVREMLGL
jgi:glutamyl-tRNA reductase